MKTICGTGLALLGAAALLAFAAQGGSNEKKGSLKSKMVGAWTMQSNVLDQGGTKSEPYPGGKGSVIFTNNGRVALVITSSGLPKFASNNRTTGTAEENKAVVQGSIAYFGTYTVNDADKTLTMHLEGCTFPNWTGTDQKRTLELSGDELKFINQAASMGPGTITVTWKRVKEGSKTASARTPEVRQGG
jgi:FlaG/FlaF family flagellin (archaellin)